MISFQKKMLVEALTAKVAQQQNHLASEFTGVSDHLMHLQEFELKTKDGSSSVIVASFNVLAQIWVWYQSGRPTAPGATIPEWYSLADQQGFENCPMSQEEYAPQRRAAVVGMITEFLEAMRDEPAVLCLQECSVEIVDDIKAKFPGIEIFIEPRSTNSHLVTILRNVTAPGGALMEQRCLACPINLRGLEQQLWIINCHLEFNTSKNEAIFEALSKKLGKEPALIIGDYNIPTMPISERAKNEGCTKTLAEFINETVVAKLGWHYDIACHYQQYTHWNCRKNCADPSSNVDHFDNILFLHDGTYESNFNALRGPDPGEWWKVKN